MYATKEDMGMARKDGEKKGTLRSSFIFMAVMPVLSLGIILAFFSTNRFGESIYTEVETELENTALMVANIYDRIYPGDYNVVSTDKLTALRKGDKYLAETLDFLENIYEDTDSEITFFYGDIRYVTTLEDNDGNSMAGTRANVVVKKEVIDGNTSRFYRNVDVNGRQMSAYYLPLHNADGGTVGMLAILRDAETVNGLVFKSVFPIALISAIAMVLVAAFTILYSNKIVVKLEKIKKFLLSVERGELRTPMDETILSRDDELGHMSRAAVSMQKSLIQLVERDALTSIYNRRYANKKLHDILEEIGANGARFAVGIGDIDFFKKVNDTYGHEAGDQILITVSRVLKEYMAGKGFVARWGGEEFLLVFTDCDERRAEEALNELLDRVHKISVEYDGFKINVNMSFGVVGYESTGERMREHGADRDEFIAREIENTLRQADELLYYAKSSGRNRVVSSLSRAE
ncbi:MAG: diguanylate cyclase [Butyrivibrio sp.]|nr:diguanylate cyclase [Butyrivibrio sp.]